MNVTLGGLTFMGDGTNATYTVAALPGWLDGVGTRRDSIPRPSAHGDFDVPTYLSGRVVSIVGMVHAGSVSAYEAAIADLTGLLADGSSGEMSVAQASGTLTAMVRRDGEPDIQHVVYGQTARFRVQFWAADPRRYGVTHTYGPLSTVTGVSQDGNFPASPVLTVSGSSGGGYTVTGPGSRLITVTEPLVTGFPHTLVLASGALMVDAARVLGGVSVYEPWTVPPGVSVTVSVSAGTVAVEVRDTWL